jgi:putative photosynthetic complex assembly protein
MSTHAVPDRLPRGPLIALAGLALATLLFAGVARLTGLGTAQNSDAATVATLELRFEDRDDGGIDILHGRSGERIGSVAPGTNGFLRSAMRGLVRERKRSDVGPAVPFRLLGRADGRLTLEDPTTGRRIDLESFGATNAATFARLLQPQRQP